MDLIRYCRIYFILLLKFVLRFVPKRKNLILFSAWFGQKYADSSKCMFEYLIKNSDYEVYWFTRNRNLFYELKDRKIPVLFAYSIKGIWFQIRAKMLVSAIQMYDFNNYFYSNCIFLDLDHGFVLKDAGLKILESNLAKKYFLALRRGCEYWMSASTPFGMRVKAECYQVDKSHIVKCQMPRVDALFDKSLQLGKNMIIDKIKCGRKAIIWMPTHRQCGKEKISISNLVNLKQLQSLCEQYNIVFIVKKHFYHAEEYEDFSQYPNIFDVTHEDIDSQVILAQADALVSDYSASYIEYLVLDRPIILYAFDLEKYIKQERNLYIKFQDNTAGAKVFSSQELLESIKRICCDWYDHKFAMGRKKARSLYFDETPVGHYREQVKQIMDQLLLGTYKPNWDENDSV